MDFQTGCRRVLAGKADNNMTTIIGGQINLVRAIASHEIWLCEKFSRGQAWADLLLLANNEERDTFIKGVKVNLKRGQLAWSQHSLAARWQWTRIKVAGYLQWLAERSMLTVDQSNLTSIITITNYDIYQSRLTAETDVDLPINNRVLATAVTTDDAAEVATAVAAGMAADDTRKVEGRRKKEEESAREEAGFCPADSEVLAFAAAWPGELATGTPGPIQAAFAEAWLARMLGRNQFPPRWQRALVADWRTASRPGTFAAAPTGGQSMQKNGAALVASSKRLDVVRRELAATRAEAFAFESCGAEVPANVKTRRSALQEELIKLGGVTL
jgi:hypothetical protein